MDFEQVKAIWREAAFKGLMKRVSPGLLAPFFRSIFSKATSDLLILSVTLDAATSVQHLLLSSFWGLKIGAWTGHRKLAGSLMKSFDLSRLNADIAMSGKPSATATSDNRHKISCNPI